MPQRALHHITVSKGTRFWMRAVSFAGLHRMLHAAAAAPNRRTTAFGLNALVVQNEFTLTRRPGVPSPTTFYHYRTTLLRLGALCRTGRFLSPNETDPHVRTLLEQPPPANADGLSDRARDGFAALVLNNEDCRALFLDLFMPGIASRSVSTFRRDGLPVQWRRDGTTKSRRVVFQPAGTGRSRTYASPVQITAILYGVRYWVRDELGLIDEYVGSADGSATMFPVSQPEPTVNAGPNRPPPLVGKLLDERGPGEWTLLSVSDLIARHCRDGRRPISALFGAIDWLVRNRSEHTALIATSRAMATLTATSPQQERLVLRRYFRGRGKEGPYISHVRLHAGIAPKRQAPNCHHAGSPNKSEARV